MPNNIHLFENNPDPTTPKSFCFSSMIICRSINILHNLAKLIQLAPDEPQQQPTWLRQMCLNKQNRWIFSKECLSAAVLQKGSDPGG